MANRDALRRFSSKLPTPPEIEAVLLNLIGEKDISVALVGTAIIEAYLENLIKSKLTNKDANLEGQIFLNKGPLSDFHSKILVARAFGVITSPMAHDFQCMKAIRNAFAHAKQMIDFNNDLIAKEIAAMLLPQAIMRGKPIAPRKAFTLALRVHMVMMENMTSFNGLADEALAHALQ